MVAVIASHPLPMPQPRIDEAGHPVDGTTRTASPQQRAAGDRSAWLGSRARALVAVAFVLGLIASLPGFLAWLSSPPATVVAPAGAVAGDPLTHVVRPGDTIWSIAEDHAPGVDVRPLVDAMVDLNGGSSLQVGQVLLIPTG